MTDVMRIPEAADGVRPAGDAGVAEKPRRVRRVAARAGKVALKVLAGYYAFCLVLLVGYRFVAPPITAVQLQRRLEAVVTGKEYSIDRNIVPRERIPRHVARAVVAAEDGDFWKHWGFDFDEMRAASMDMFDGGMPRGASTITQQLMKNLFGTTNQNPLRKLLDMTLTPPAELILGKERILEIYLNNVEWGPGIFGIDAAARHHYGTTVRGLSRSQAAGLAALLPNPLRRTPENTPHYRAEILRRMNHRGW
jgi:monofunctional biosynthetic peptidoglycan transglycosylase